MEPIDVDVDGDGDGDDGSPSPEEAGKTEHARPRKRTRRACDKCSTSRTRCDGERPCRRCQDYGYTCRYNREIRKRGRIPTSLLPPAPSPNHPASFYAAPSAPRRRRGRPSRNSASGQPADGPSPASSGPSPNSLPSPLAGSLAGSPRFPNPPHHRNGLPPVSHSPASNPPTPGAVLPGTVLPQPQPPSLPPHLPPPVPHSVPHSLPPSLPLSLPPSAAAPAAAPATAPYLPSPDFTGGSAPLQLSDLLDSSADPHVLASYHEGPPAAGAGVSGSGVGYPPPANGVAGHPSHENPAPGPAAPGDDATLPDMQQHSNSLYRAPSSDCRYRFLDPVLPYLRGIVPASVAADLLDVYLTEPGSSLFRCASPYILTRVFRKKSVLHPSRPRPTTPALLATILWCAAQTADIVLLHVPGSRSRITNALYNLATFLISERDPDRWRRIHGGLRVENEQPQPQVPFSSALPNVTETNEPVGVVDDVLTFLLLSVAVSGGDFKSDSYKWWSKAIRLTLALKLNREDERCPAATSPCANPLCPCRRDQAAEPPAAAEAREERRRVFWLLYCLDRHLSLSFNTIVDIPDSYCEVYAPLPESIWENLDAFATKKLPVRTVGPPTVVSGTGFFEYFLPLMAILGDIIEVHHRRQHPRLGGREDEQAVTAIRGLLMDCERSLDALAREGEQEQQNYVPLAPSAAPSIKELTTRGDPEGGLTTSGDLASSSGGGMPTSRPGDRSRTRLVAAYGTHILHVLHVLLYGKWDAISMLDDDDDWITSERFNACASHAIAASQAVSRILESDPELTFMPYLFGIYLLHGSFILLLFADRMPQLGPNQSVEQACETIIRAHEVCVVTLSTEFQKNFRKVLRSTLYSVRGSSPAEMEEHRARRRALSLYRWTRGAKGLGL